MTADPATLARVRTFVLAQAADRARQLGLDPAGEGLASGDRSLTSGGLFDSMAFLDLLAALERAFGIELDLSEAEPASFTMLDGLCAQVAGAIAAATPPAPAPAAIPAPAAATCEPLMPDHAQWPRLGDLFDEMYAHFARHGLRVPLAPEGRAEWLRAVAAGAGKTHHVIGGFAEGRLVGFVHCSLRLLPAYLGAGLAGSIDHVYVTPSQRRHGLARALVVQAEAWLASRHAATVELQVLVGNTDGIGFWKAAGYEPELLQMRKGQRPPAP